MRRVSAGKANFAASVPFVACLSACMVVTELVRALSQWTPELETGFQFDVLVGPQRGIRKSHSDELSKVRSGSGLGLFVREMIGLDREAAKRAFDGFLTGKTLTANQVHSVNLVIDYLTQSGWMRAAQLYESPFTDYSPRGVEGVFDSAQVTQLLSILDNIRQAASVS